MRRISWKKGMRLTDDILRASDESSAELIGKALILASAGRFGLLPSQRPFYLSLNITKNLIDVESLYCLALTKGGDLIDTQYDSRYNNNFDTRIEIPNIAGAEEYILVINACPGQWKDTFEGFEEPVYTFSLIAPDSAIDEHSFPIGRIVDDHGWRMDDIDFLPPCLFVKSHHKYEELLQRFSEVLSALDTKSRAALSSAGRNVISVFWPLVQQVRIAVSKECDLMTPMSLLSNVQKCVSAFTCACDLDESLELTDAKMFRSYVMAPYTYKEAYQRIKIGLDICFSISQKVDVLAGSAAPEPEVPQASGPSCPPTPKLAPNQLQQECDTSETSISLAYGVPSANIFFTIDGSEPHSGSMRAAKTRSGFSLKFDNGFRKEKGKESDRKVTLKMIAVVDGVSSASSTCVVSLRKSVKFRNAIPI